MTLIPQFDGNTFLPKRDEAALSSQLDETRSVILGGGWWTLAELADAVSTRLGKKATEAAVSARLRDLRKVRFGSYNIEKRIRENTDRLYEYHLGANTGPVPDHAHGKTRSETAG